MHPAVDDRDQLTSSAPWPNRWMTVPEFTAELEQQGFWSRVGLAGLTDADRQRFLRATFQARRPQLSGCGGAPLHTRIPWPRAASPILRSGSAAAGLSFFSIPTG